MDEVFPILVVAAFETKDEPNANVITKAFVSSLLRSLFSGTVMVLGNRELSLFKVERKLVKEIYLPLVITEDAGEARRKIGTRFLTGIANHVKPTSNQWVVVADCATLALRNIDHLFPPDGTGSYGPQQIEFQWVDSEWRDPESNEMLAAQGFWAVKGSRLPQLLDDWEKLRTTAPPPQDALEEARLWTRFIRSLDLAKRRFEHGEAISPGLHGVDWDAVHEAALVSVPDWPTEQRMKFIQSLYYGTYFGDSTGMMLNILEP